MRRVVLAGLITLVTACSFGWEPASSDAQRRAQQDGGATPRDDDASAPEPAPPSEPDDPGRPPDGTLPQAHGGDGGPSPVDAGVPVTPTSGDAGTKNDGGATSPVDPNTGSTTTASADAGRDAALPAKRGPYIDEAAIPRGSLGYGEPRLMSTSERPKPELRGAFRTGCSYSHMSFDDPILAPGVVRGGALGAFFGNTAANAATTPETLRARGNSTCSGGTVDRSIYRMPVLVDSDGRPIEPFEFLVEYLAIGPVGTVKNFPTGLRIVAGDPSALGEQLDVKWQCLGTWTGNFPFIPTCQPGDRELQLLISFPQCWDGKNLDSPDHRSHMARADDRERCPASHPVLLPTLTYFVRYRGPERGTSGLRLASDTYDPTLPGGYGTYAGYMDGWDPAIAQIFMERCLRASLDCHYYWLGDGRILE